MKKLLKETKQKGITLVALVITIIILLILAAISIQALTNQGIFAQAENAKRESEIASIKEQIALDIYEKQLVPPVGSITEEQLETILEKHGTIIYEEDGVTIKGITTAKGYEILLKDIYGGETVVESVPDGAIVTPVNDITTWLKTGEISKQYSYTTIEQIIADSTCIQSLMNNENAMKYLARSTDFLDAICTSETAMTYLGKSAYVDGTVLNSDLCVEKICNSVYIEKIFQNLLPTLSSNNQLTNNGVGIVSSSGHYANSDSLASHEEYRAFDNDDSTDWGDDKKQNSYLQFMFNQTVTARYIVIKTRHIWDSQVSVYSENPIYIYNGSSWELFDYLKGDILKVTPFVYSKILNKQIRGIKFVGSINNHGVVNEIKVYGRR